MFCKCTLLETMLSEGDSEIVNLKPIDDREQCARSWGQILETQVQRLSEIVQTKQPHSLIMKFPQITGLRCGLCLRSVLPTSKIAAQNERHLRQRRSQGGEVRQGLLHLWTEERKAIL